MTNLKQLFSRPLQAVPYSFVVALLVVAVLGFVDALYLTIEHYENVIPPCTITGGCETVLTSAYSSILGMPVSLGGVIYYLLVLIGIFAYLNGRHEKLFRWALILTFIGFLASLWFLFVQAFILHAYCLYCLGSALTSTILFVIAVVIFRKYSVSQE
jgi:uncharacterized membrane protein